MKKISKKSKIYLLLFVISLVTTVLFSGICALLDAHGLFLEDKASAMKNITEELQTRYSLYALAQRDDGYNMDAINETNLHLGVIKNNEEEIGLQEIKDLKKYEIENFDESFDPEKVFVYSTDLGENDSVDFDMRTWIFGYAYKYHVDTEEDADSIWVNVANYYYNFEEEQLYIKVYYKGENRIYPYPFNVENEDYEIIKLDNKYNKVEHGDSLAQWKDTTELVTLTNATMTLGEITLVDTEQLLREGNLDQNSYVADIEEGVRIKEKEHVKAEEDKEKTTYYHVISYVNDPIRVQEGEGYFCYDLFVQAQKWVDLLHSFRAIAIPGLVISILALIISGIYLFWHIGKRIVAVFMEMALMKKAVAVIVGLSLLCGFFTLAIDEEVFVLWLVIWVLFVLPLYCYVMLQLRNLQQGAMEIANGNLEYQVDTSRMIGDMKKHGEYLNSIQKSIAVAVEKQIQSERMKTELITNVSHDIKTPLTCIINYVDLLEKEQIQNENASEYIEVLGRQSDKLKKLIEDLIEASKASTGNIEIQLEECDASVVLNQAISEYEEKLENHHLNLITNECQDTCHFMADGRCLWRVFDNILSNIVKYSLEGTRVFVQWTKVNEKIIFTFKNTSREELKVEGSELLERFVRGDQSRNTEGNGLGLAIAQSLTSLMGGELSVEVDGDLFKVTVVFDCK